MHKKSDVNIFLYVLVLNHTLFFLNDLPNKKDTTCFSTEDASGSTSQAAGIVESMEAGSQVFLLDEDTSATNFMVRDSFMQSQAQWHWEKFIHSDLRSERKTQ